MTLPHPTYEVRCPVRRCGWTVTANVVEPLLEAWKAHSMSHDRRRP